MLRRIEPERIICYNEPFPEMEGNIVYVDYELSSWKYQGEKYVPSKYLPYICGEAPLPPDSGIVIKEGRVLRDDIPCKGMGSAYGGEWKPAKAEDERFLGEPGEVKQTQSGGKRGGYHRETKIGPDGRATRERHYTDHDNPGEHSDPHDHEINWSEGHPRFGKQINYPDNPPEFKQLKGGINMVTMVGTNTPEENRFKSISDFKWCMRCGGEVQFEWKGKIFGVFPFQNKTADSPDQILITQVLVDNMEETEKWCDTADEVLEYVIDGDRLRDIITQVEVLDRTI